VQEDNLCIRTGPYCAGARLAVDEHPFAKRPARYDQRFSSVRSGTTPGSRSSRCHDDQLPSGHNTEEVAADALSDDHVTRSVALGDDLAGDP
jgi:hypothetical protein